MFCVVTNETASSRTTLLLFCVWVWFDEFINHAGQRLRIQHKTLGHLVKPKCQVFILAGITDNDTYRCKNCLYWADIINKHPYFFLFIICKAFIR